MTTTRGKEFPLYCWGAVRMEGGNFASMISYIYPMENNRLEKMDWIFSGKRFGYIHESYLYGKELCTRYNKYYKFISKIWEYS